MRGWALVGLAHEVTEALPSRTSGQGVVYGIEMRPGAVKIGFTCDPRGRLRALLTQQRIYGHDAVGRAAVSVAHSGARKTEAFLLASLASHRIEGELVAATLEEIGSVIESRVLEVNDGDRERAAQRAARTAAIAAWLHSFSDDCRGLFIELVERLGVVTVAARLGTTPYQVRRVLDGAEMRADWMFAIACTEPEVGARMIDALIERAKRAPNLDKNPSIAKAIREEEGCE